VVCSARAQERGDFVGVGEAWFGSVIEQFNLNIEGTKVLIHGELHLLGQGDLVLGKLVGFGVAIADLCAEGVLLRVRLMAAIRLDPFLNFGISVLDKPDALVVLAVFVGDFILDEADLLGEILDAVYPVV
jgi:hypothetical protein